MVQVEGTEVLTYGAPWGDTARAALTRDGEKCTLTVCVPGYGEMVVSAGGDLTGGDTLDAEKIWQESGQDYGVQKEFYWELAELLTGALEWAQERCPLFPKLSLDDWKETDYGWRAERNGVMLRLDPEDGLVVVADPFGA